MLLGIAPENLSKMMEIARASSSLEKDLRILEIRRLLSSLSELGLAGEIARKHELTDQDLELLAHIETEVRRIRKERGKNGTS